MRSRLVLVYYFGEILKMLIWLKNDQLIVVSLLARGITLLSPYLPMVANARLVPYDFLTDSVAVCIYGCLNS